MDKCNHKIARAVNVTDDGEHICKCFCLRCYQVFAKGLNPGEAAVFESEFREEEVGNGER